MISIDTKHIDNKKSTRMVAHRGASALETENSNAAFVAAGNRSYYGIETDVHVTRDGKLLIIHDDNTGRVCPEKLSVEGSDYDDLRRLRLIDKYTGRTRSDHVLPDLRDYASICKKYGKVPVLELKNKMDWDAISRVVDTMRDEGVLEDTIFISFCMENLEIIRELIPTQTVQFLTDKITDELITTLVDKKMDLDVRYDALTEENMQKLHKNGITVNAWTVDDPEACRRLIDWGIDYITSNCCE